jgi:hypothetical protein
VSPLLGRRAQLVMAVLLVASAVLLVVGVAAERSQGDAHDETPAVVHDEAAEGSKAHEREAAEHDEAGETSAQHAAEGDERLLGVKTESTPGVAAAVLISLLLAAGTLWRPSRALTAGAALLAVVAVVVDVAEIAHQLNEGRSGIALVAALVLVLHAGVVASGAVAWRSTEPLEPASAAQLSAGVDREGRR